MLLRIENHFMVDVEIRNFYILFFILEPQELSLPQKKCY